MRVPSQGLFLDLIWAATSKRMGSLAAGFQLALGWKAGSAIGFGKTGVLLAQLRCAGISLLIGGEPSGEKYSLESQIGSYKAVEQPRKYD